MKKFKLIKEYPGSPKLETIVKVESDNYIHWNVNSNYNNPTNYIHSSSMKQYKEFWEEVVEKDYEILSFTNNENLIWIKAKDGRFNAKWQMYRPTEEDSLKEPGITIHSVKRLSDGEIFTVGDITNEGDKILAINEGYGNGGLWFDITNKKFGNGFSITNYNIKIRKKPLFTTEDGVDIFEGDIIYGVSNNWKVFSHFTDLQNKVKSWGIKPIFSTKEKAEEYILLNKPCLSIKDVLSISTITSNPFGFQAYLEESLIKLVKEKQQ